MSKALPRLLIISNMGPKASAPVQGQFVLNQVQALSAFHPAYHYMRWHSDSWLNKLLKYPVFLIDFIFKFVFCTKKFDVVHVHFFYPTIFLALLYKMCRNPKVKIIVTCHGSDIYKYPNPSTLYRYCASKVDKWIFASHALKAHFSLSVNNALVLSAGINSVFNQVNMKRAAEKNIDLLFVGTLDHNKGIDRLITLLTHLSDKRIVIVGMGPYYQSLLTLTEQYPNLQVLGNVQHKELAALYASARCFISLSRKEAFGLVMAEAMACYTPVLATITDGSKEQINEAHNGFFVKQSDDEKQFTHNFLDAYERMFAQSEVDYEAMQINAHESAKPYVIDNISNTLTALYQSIYHD